MEKKPDLNCRYIRMSLLYVVLLQILQGETRPCCDGNGVGLSFRSLKQDADPLKHKEGPNRLKQAQNLVNEAADTITMSVMEGDSVNLHTNLTELQREDHILWMLKNNSVDTLIADIHKLYNSSTIYDDDNKRFKGRLKLDSQTGSLNITNTRITDSGLYKVEIINGRGTSYKRFNVTVNARLSLPVISRNSSNCSSSSETSSDSKCGLVRIGLHNTAAIIIVAAIGVVILAAMAVITFKCNNQTGQKVQEADAIPMNSNNTAPDGDGVTSLVTSNGDSHSNP